jgi:carboxylate-amine ligase
MALAANAPFLEGADTGLATVRPKLCEGFPRQGVPPAFASLDELVDLVAWGRRGGSFPDASFLWHELRLHPVHGTIEVRVPDAQSRLDDLGAVAAVVHALVVEMAERHDAGEPLVVHDKLRIDENRWRALRHGVHGHLVDLDSGEPAPTREVLRRLLDRLAPTADRLGCAAELAHARTLLAGTGADRQRAVRARASLRKLAGWLVEETEAVPETRAPAAT